MVNLMSISRDEFDPLAIAVDWLDACRTGELSALLDLYDEQATLECDCERVILGGRKSIAPYWAPKIESKLVSAFTLDDITLTGDRVQVDYQNYEGNPVPESNFGSVPRARYSTPVAAHCDSASAVGTFETCRPAVTESASGGRPDVVCRRPKWRD
jgi:hypothetical protein